MVQCSDCGATVDSDDAEECAYCGADGMCEGCLMAHEEACAESED